MRRSPTVSESGDAVRDVDLSEEPLAGHLRRRVGREHRRGGQGDGERRRLAQVVVAQQVVHHQAHLPERVRQVQLQDALGGRCSRAGARRSTARRGGGGGGGARALDDVPEVEQQRLAPAERVERLVRRERLHRTRPDEAHNAERSVLALEPRDQTAASTSARLHLQTGRLRLRDRSLLQTMHLYENY